jgi:hypothetical protein
MVPQTRLCSGTVTPKPEGSAELAPKHLVAQGIMRIDQQPYITKGVFITTLPLVYQ